MVCFPPFVFFVHVLLVLKADKIFLEEERSAV